MPSLEKIYIHTYGRSDKPIATWESLTPALRKRAVLLVQNRERKLYGDYPNVEVLPVGINRLSPTRQWIVDNSEARFICMMDDDLINFGFRREGDWHLKVATNKEVQQMFSWCGKQLNDVAHCGLSPRVQNHTFEGDVKKVGRMTQMLCYDLEVLRQHDFRFDRVPCMQDFDMTLQLLTSGYSNHILYKGCTNARGTGTKGGCASYRTPDMQSATAKRLAKLHAPFVKLREKQTAGWPTPVTDVTVYWKKAYESSQC